MWNFYLFSFSKAIMRLFFIIISSILFLSGCISSKTTVTTKNSGAGGSTQFQPAAAAKTRVKLALVYMRNNNMQAAKQNLDMALEYQPKSGDVHRAFAYYYQTVDENDSAEEYYKKSLRLDSTNADTYNNYGTFLCQLERYEEAEVAFLQAIEQTRYSSVANTYENAGLCAQKAKADDKALEFFQSALSHNPNKSYINLYLAKLNIDRKDYPTARSNLLNYQKKSKASAESLWQWIRLSYATEKGASLSKYVGQLLEKFPDSQRALDYLNHEYY